MIGFVDVFKDVLKKIDSLETPYMLVGSIASMYYGEARLTQDMDIVLDIHERDVLKFADLFSGSDYYCPPDEILSSEVINKGQFNLIHPKSGLKVDVIVKKVSPFDESRFARRKKVSLWEGLEVQIASPEDVIIKKFEYYRDGGSEKHIRDIKSMVAHTPLDTVYIATWCQKLGLMDQHKIVFGV